MGKLAEVPVRLLPAFPRASGDPRLVRGSPNGAPPDVELPPPPRGEGLGQGEVVGAKWGHVAEVGVVLEGVRAGPGPDYSAEEGLREGERGRVLQRQVWSLMLPSRPGHSPSSPSGKPP